MRKSIKMHKKHKYTVAFPDGTTMILGQGDIPTSHEGVPAKDFARALEKAAKAVSDAGIFDSEGDAYGHRPHTTAR